MTKVYVFRFYTLLGLHCVRFTLGAFTLEQFTLMVAHHRFTRTNVYTHVVYSIHYLLSTAPAAHDLKVEARHSDVNSPVEQDTPCRLNAPRPSRVRRACAASATAPP